MKWQANDSSGINRKVNQLPSDSKIVAISTDADYTAVEDAWKSKFFPDTVIIG